MKSINLIVLEIIVLASLAFVVTMQEQDVAAFNDKNSFVNNGHFHQKCDTVCQSNGGSVVNTEDMHNNENCNSQRDVACRTNSVTKP
jgi:hypothetical protein